MQYADRYVFFARLINKTKDGLAVWFEADNNLKRLLGLKENLKVIACRLDIAGQDVYYVFTITEYPTMADRYTFNVYVNFVDVESIEYDDKSYADDIAELYKTVCADTLQFYDLAEIAIGGLK